MKKKTVNESLEDGETVKMLLKKIKTVNCSEANRQWGTGPGAAFPSSAATLN